ncbi:hypothetical protein [Aquibacillus saliphilus]|uniref:hypothetical protein n=1 Tax=Aquibacillus saliphilus TaxID=1909422 RepID=UPI001CF061C8|nr:hypothetical protein [Aquibacillus saliphilus]
MNQLERLINKTKTRNHSIAFQTNNEMKAARVRDSLVVESKKSLKINYPDVDPEFHVQNSIYQPLLFCNQKDQLDYELSYDQLRCTLAPIFL